MLRKQLNLLCNDFSTKAQQSVKRNHLIFAYLRKISTFSTQNGSILGQNGSKRKEFIALGNRHSVPGERNGPATSMCWPMVKKAQLGRYNGIKCPEISSSMSGIIALA